MGFLGAQALVKLGAMPDAKDLFPAGSEVVRAYEYHQGQEVQMGSYKHFLPECGTERLALAAKVREPDSKETVLFYVYAAMSLARQHDLQQTILVRCTSNVVGAAMVSAAITLGAHDVYSLQCIAAGDTEQAALRAQWGMWASTLGLPEPKPLAVAGLEQEMLHTAQPGSSLEDNAAVICFLVKNRVGTDVLSAFESEISGRPWRRQMFARWTMGG